MKKWKFLTAAAALTLMLAACGDDEAKDTSAEDTGAETTQTEEATGAFPMTIASLSASQDDEESGKTITFEDVTLEKMPERIITLDYGFLIHLMH